MGKQKRFKLEAVAYFYANDIDDAFLELSKHFKKLADGEDDLQFFDAETNISIKVDK